MTEEQPQNSGGLSDEDRAKLEAAQKRNFIFALIGGLILAVLGFFAAQNLKSNDDAPTDVVTTQEQAEITDTESQGK